MISGLIIHRDRAKQNKTKQYECGREINAEAGHIRGGVCGSERSLAQ